MIKLIDTEDYREEIKRLWSVCFGDERSYVEFFLDNCPHECIGLFHDNMLVSMLFLLDGKIGSFRIKYIYAACTQPEFRNRGYMAELISFSKDFCQNQKYDGLFLVPAEDSLYVYYQKMGFIPNFQRYDISFKFHESNYCEELNETKDIETVSSLRNLLLNKENSFIFTDKTAEYVIKEFIFSGGHIFCNTENDNNYLTFVSYSNNNVEIKEFLSSTNVKMLKIFKHFINNDTENIYIRCPIVYNNIDIMVKCTKCGMSYPLTDEFKEASVNKVFYAGMYLD